LHPSHGRTKKKTDRREEKNPQKFFCISPQHAGKLSSSQGKRAQKITSITVLHEATLSFLCTPYVPCSTNEAKPHTLTLFTIYQIKKGKQGKEGIHNHTGKKPGALDR
jgi:hypothetical protein